MKNKLFVLLFASFFCNKLISQNLPFDSIRFSSDGKYSLVFEERGLNNTNAAWWILYKNGLNQTSDTIAIYNDTVYKLQYHENESRKNRKCTLYSENKDTSFFCIVEKMQLSTYIKRYNLDLKGSNYTYNLETKLDTLFSNKIVVADQSHDSPSGTKHVPIYTVKISYLINGKILYSDTIKITTENFSDIKTSLNEINAELKNSQENNILYASKDNRYYFIKSMFSIENYSGRHYYGYVDGVETTTYDSSGENHEVRYLK